MIPLTSARSIIKNISRLSFVLTALTLVASTALANVLCSDAFDARVDNPFLDTTKPIFLTSARVRDSRYRSREHIMTVSAINQRGLRVDLRLFRSQQDLDKILSRVSEQINILMPGARFWLLSDRQVRAIDWGEFKNISRKIPIDVQIEAVAVEMPKNFFLYRKARLENPLIRYFFRNLNRFLRQNNMRLEQVDLRESENGEIFLYNPENIRLSAEGVN